MSKKSDEDFIQFLGWKREMEDDAVARANRQTEFERRCNEDEDNLFEDDD